MVLIIAEKPELGRAIGAALQDSHPAAGNTIQGRLHGKAATVIWCFGHMLELYDPEDYDERYGTWKMEDLPLYFPGWKLKPIKKVEARFRQIVKCVKEADQIVHAGDIDEEGQLLVDEILDYCKYRGPVYRLNTNDTSHAKLQKALDNMVPNDEKLLARGRSAMGRRICDKLFGYNLTRYYTLKNQTEGDKGYKGALLPVGRVKMPTLGLVVHRDQLIEGHKKILYYTLSATLTFEGKSVPVKFEPNSEDPHLSEGMIQDRAYLDGIARILAGRTLSPIMVSKTTETGAPPLPFNMNTLYTYCGKKWGMKPTRVLEITQSLRDKHQAITYNRSDCQYLSTEMYEEAPETLPAICANLKLDPGQFDLSIKSRCFNDANLTAHMAIIPTQAPVSRTSQNSLTQDEWNVYQAIAKYYLIQFMPPVKKRVTRLAAPGPEKGRFTATAKEILEPGYTAFLGEEGDPDEESDDKHEETEAPILTQIPEGTYSGSVSAPQVTEKETKPPTRYTATTLVNDMASIAKYVENKAVRDLLKKKDQGKKGEHGSIGTPATRNRVVDELIKAGYLREERKGKQTYLISTPLGREFYDILPDSVRKVDVSAKWWVEQQEICAGHMTPEQMAQDVLKTVSAIIATGDGTMKNAGQYAQGIVDSTSLGQCPHCGNSVAEGAKAFRCTGTDCDFAILKKDAFFASMGKQVTAKVVTEMLRDHQVHLTGCKKKNGDGTYDTVILCSFPTDSPFPKYAFAQAEDLPAIGICPKCGGKVVERGPGFCCSADGCKFIIWKEDRFFESKGKKMTAALATALLRDRRVKLVGCKSSKGKKYDCYVSVDYSGDRTEYSSELCSKAPGKHSDKKAPNPRDTSPLPAHTPPPPQAADFW